MKDGFGYSIYCYVYSLLEKEGENTDHESVVKKLMTITHKEYNDWVQNEITKAFYIQDNLNLQCWTPM